MNLERYHYLTPNMDNDFELLLWMGAGVLLLTLITEGFSRQNWLPQWLARKILHVGAVGACGLAALWIEKLSWLAILVSVAEILLLLLVASGKLFSESGKRKSWGIALFPLAFLLLLWWFPQQRWLIALPMFILAVSDAAAAIVGQFFARQYFQLTGDRKSLTGSYAFLGSGLLLLLLLKVTAGQIFPASLFDKPADWLFAAALLAILALIEAFGSRGWDNFFIPLAAALLFRQFSGMEIDIGQAFLFWGNLFFLGLLAYFARRRNMLTLDGGLMAALLGIWIIFFAGWLWLLPPLVFFASSSLLGRLDKGTVKETDAKQGKARDHMQVICNGGIYGILASLLPFFEQEHIFLLMVLSMAVSTADTWSSEVGIYFRGKTIDMLRLRPAPVGLSGGVSLQGTLAGMLGAVLIASLLFILPEVEATNSAFFLIFLGGTAGMLLDSLLGASIQARYFNPGTQKLQDTRVEHQEPALGWAWMNNDLVNLIANALIIITGWSLFL